MSCCPGPDGRPYARTFRRLILAVLLIWTARTCASDLVPVWIAVYATADASALDQLLLRDAKGRLWAQRADLAIWGLETPQGEAFVHDEIEWFALDAQTAMRPRFDVAEQALWLDVQPQVRSIQLRSLRDARLPADAGDVEPGGWLDADLQVLHGRQDSAFAGLLGASLFNDRGFGSVGGIGSDRGFVRLDSTWSVEKPDALERVDLGDAIVRAGAWGRALRFGGISLGTDFALQPDLVTFPQPELRGVAELPSTLDVYVNGLLARQENVGAGPFVLSDIPVQDGPNRTRVVVRDALGREQVLTQAFYAPAQLLKPGLRDVRLDAGWLREDYGRDSFDYGTGFLAASVRQGLGENFTLETRGEAGAHRQAGGLGATIALPSGGTGELAVAGSRAGAGLGGLVRAGMDWRSASGWSLGTRVRRVSDAWTDLGERVAQRRQQLSTNLGMVPAPGWSAALTWVRQSERGSSRQELVVLGLSTRLAGNWFVGANFVQVLSEDRAGFASLNLVGRFGGATQVLETRHAGGRESSAVEWQRNTEDALDNSLRLRAQSAEAGRPARLQAETRMPGTHGEIGMAIARDDDATALRLDGSTRLAWLGRDRFWTRTGAEGFAVIDAHGLANVGVRQDQRLAARTDARGMALIPGLRPWQPNRFDLVDADVPIDAEVQALDRVVVPATRGGTRIAFAVNPPRGQGLRLLLPDGRPVPAGARVRDPLTGLRVPLGQDGRAWWPHGELPDALEVETRGQVCRVRVPRDHAPEPDLRTECGVRS